MPTQKQSPNLTHKSQTQLALGQNPDITTLSDEQAASLTGGAAIALPSFLNQSNRPK